MSCSRGDGRRLRPKMNVQIRARCTEKTNSSSSRLTSPRSVIEQDRHSVTVSRGIVPSPPDLGRHQSRRSPEEEIPSATIFRTHFPSTFFCDGARRRAPETFGPPATGVGTVPRRRSTEHSSLLVFVSRTLALAPPPTKDGTFRRNDPGLERWECGREVLCARSRCFENKKSR